MRRLCRLGERSASVFLLLSIGFAPGFAPMAWADPPSLGVVSDSAEEAPEQERWTTFQEFLQGHDQIVLTLRELGPHPLGFTDDPGKPELAATLNHLLELSPDQLGAIWSPDLEGQISHFVMSPYTSAVPRKLAEEILQKTPVRSIRGDRIVKRLKSESSNLIVGKFGGAAETQAPARFLDALEKLTSGLDQGITYGIAESKTLPPSLFPNCPSIL